MKYFILFLVILLSPTLKAGVDAIPTVSNGGTTISLTPLNRLGLNSTVISADFTDTDQPTASSFSVTFKIREPNNTTELILVNNLTHGLGGLSVIDNGGGSYTASYTYDPVDIQTIGLYDLYFAVDDNTGSTIAVDDYTNNLDELEINNIIPNNPPVVQTDATLASPAGVERIGANLTTLTTKFTDLDLPAINSFQITYKLRYTTDQSEIILADNATDGTSGLTITDLGSGVYEASISWDPSDIQPLGFYDLYFHVTDGVDFSFDGFQHNLDELQVFDAISNKIPGLVADTTYALPTSINRIGTQFTMLKSIFYDGDFPGNGAFTVTFKVRDQNSFETIISNSALNGEQGVRIVHLGDSLYEAAVLWDPSETVQIGTYDLYFEVTDDKGANVIDDYTINADELTITSSTIAGDGFLLHRTNNADGCGGPTNACHNLEGHQSQDCRVCHEPHSTKNIYLVKDSIQTPNSGLKEVIFKTLGIGDPYNTPDPVVGDPTSGVMADATDGVSTGVCEVCHTTTGHHRNDGSQMPDVHNDADDCTQCHLHTDGFKGGESGGGLSCSCHGDILTAMDSSSVLFRHVLANDAPNYSPGASGLYTIKNCLSCHVDHDIFRPDLNPGIGTRASNLRADWAIDPVSGDNTALLNSDYQSTGSGGLCLSCHDDPDPSCSACHSAHVPPGKQVESFATATNAHIFILKTDYDSATTTHNYSIPLTFTTDGSLFNANCTKCHNDDRLKIYQNSTNKVSFHGSTFSTLLDSTGIILPTEPLEEKFCFKCHSTTSNPNAGSNLDFFGIKGMGTNALNIESAFNQASVHPITLTSGVHFPTEDINAITRHVECVDCHNPHAASTGGTGLPNSLKGVDGIDNFGNVISPITLSYQLCFKCHSANPGVTQLVTRQFNNSGNTLLEFDTASVSYHPVVGIGKNNNSPSLIGGWSETSVMTCEDCHAAANGTVNGPHGSEFSPILKLRYDTGDNLAESATRYALCYSCHDRNSILGDNSFKEHNKHIRGEDAPCSVCHDAHGSTGQAHLINFDTNICTPANGRLEFIDDGTLKGTCYVTCHGKKHSPKKY